MAAFMRPGQTAAIRRIIKKEEDHRQAHFLDLSREMKQGRGSLRTQEINGNKVNAVEAPDAETFYGITFAPGGSASLHSGSLQSQPIYCRELMLIDKRIMELSEPPMSESERRLHRFNAFVGVVIILNAVTMGFEVDYGPKDSEMSFEDRMPWNLLESIFVSFFLMELGFRCWWEGFRHWIRSWWNWLDAAVVQCAVMEIWIFPLAIQGIVTEADLSLLTLLRIVRLMRLVRVIRVVRMFRGMYAMACAFQQAMYSMVWVCCIMAIGIYVCAIFTTTVIGHSKTLRDVAIGKDTAKDRFGTLPRSIYSLFELMTLEGWHQVGRPLVMRQPLLFIFLFTYIMVFTFGLLSMIVAVVVEKTLLQAKLLRNATEKGDMNKKLKGELVAMKTVFTEADVNSDGQMTKDEFFEVMSTSRTVTSCMETLALNTRDIEALWAILDQNGTGFLTVEKLIEGCLRAQTNRDIVWDVIHTNAVTLDVQRQVSSLKECHERLKETAMEHFEEEAKALLENLELCEEIERKQEHTSSQLHEVLEVLESLEAAAPTFIQEQLE